MSQHRVRRRWIAREPGEPAKVLELIEDTMPEPPASGVVVRLQAISLNFADLLLCRGQYQDKPAFPFTPGLEGAGHVLAVGPSSRLRVGDHVAVMPRIPNGTLTDHVAVLDDEALPLPHGVRMSEAAALPVAYQTAHLALSRRARLQRDEVLLVHGGSGGSGAAAIQVGHALGARVLATARGEPSVAFCRGLGADEVIDTSEVDFVEEVKRLTSKRGADVAFDTLGGEAFERSCKCIASEGRILIIGFASGRPGEVRTNHIFIKNYSVLGLHWGRYRDEEPAAIQTAHAQLAGWCAKGSLRPPIGAVVEFLDVPGAFTMLVKREIRGKVVVTV